MVGFLPAFSSASAEKVTVVMWHTLTDHHEQVLLAIIDGFNTMQDDYVVVAQQQPYSEFDAKVMQATRNNAGPDFVSMFPSLAIQYITEGLLVDYAPYINDPDIGIPNFKDNISEGIFGEITQWGEGQVFIFPVTLTGEVLFYNKTLFDELGLQPPQTWSDVEAYSKTIYSEKGIPGFGTDSITDTFQCLIKQAGSGYIDAANLVMDVDRDIAIDKLNWFADGVKAGYFRLVGEDMYFSNPFGSGAVASYIGSSAGVNYVYAAVGGSFEVGCVPIPQEGPVKYISSWGAGDVCFSKDEAKARGVYEFLKYFASADVILDWAEGFGSVPVYKDAVATERFQAFAEGNVAIKALAEELDLVGYLDAVLGADAVRNHIDEMVQLVALGVLDAETAFDNFVEACNNEIKK